MRLVLALLFVASLPATAAAPLPVSTRPLSEVALHPIREASAQVVSLNLARLSAELSARIERIPVEPGQRIGQGAVVAELDCADTRIAAQRAQAALESSRARLALAEQQLRRARELAAQQFLSREALDAKQTEVDVVAAEVKVNTASHAAAQRDITKCLVRSPYPAIVEARLAQVGEWASPGTPLVQLWDVSRLQLAVQLQADDADVLTRAQPVYVSQGVEYPVRLLRVSPALNPTSRTREARFTFPGTVPPPGSFGVLRWRDPRAFLPAELLTRRGEALGVFVVQAGRARFVPLPGAQEGRLAATALPGDTALVIDGRFTLQDGMAVTVR